MAAVPSPTEPETSERRFGAWRVIRTTSPNGRRVLLICDCGVSREMAIDVLESGFSLGCGGCKFTRRPRTQPTPSDRAAAFAAAELRATRARKWGGGGE